MKQWIPQYNFLPRIRDGKHEYHPYLSGEAMTNLQWIADSYSNVVPVYTPKPKQLVKGDRIRITEGRFKGAEASVIIQPGAGKRDIMVCVENYMWVPLLRVQPGQYEVIALNNDNKHVYTRLENDRLHSKLHEALGRFYLPGNGVTEEDRKLAAETVSQYGSLRMDSDIMRSKLYALLLPAYTISENRQEAEKLIGTLQAMPPLIKSDRPGRFFLPRSTGARTVISTTPRLTRSSTDGGRRKHPKRASNSSSNGWKTTTAGWDTDTGHSRTGSLKSPETAGATDRQRPVRNTAPELRLKAFRSAGC